MGIIVIKPERDVDFYVGWSTNVEAPVWAGTRAEAVEHITADDRGHPADPPQVRLDRADRYGSSASPDYGFGHWGGDTFVYEQRGVLARRLLPEVCRLLDVDDQAGVWDLLEPFDDLTEVRRG